MSLVDLFTTILKETGGRVAPSDGVVLERDSVPERSHVIADAFPLDHGFDPETKFWAGRAIVPGRLKLLEAVEGEPEWKTRISVVESQ